MSPVLREPRGRKKSVLQTSMTLFADLSNEELLAEVSRLAMRERQATAALIRCLIEVDARRLYLARATRRCSPSARRRCTCQSTRRSVASRSHVRRGGCRASRPSRDGSVTVTNARMLAPHMTEANCEELLAAARHRSKREVEEIVARLRPQPDVRSTVRKLPSPRVMEKAPPPCRLLRCLRRQRVRHSIRSRRLQSHHRSRRERWSHH